MKHKITVRFLTPNVDHSSDVYHDSLRSAVRDFHRVVGRFCLLRYSVSSCNFDENGPSYCILRRGSNYAFVFRTIVFVRD